MPFSAPQTGLTDFSIAIQGELGSNSHMAAIQASADPALKACAAQLQCTVDALKIKPCTQSAEVFESLANKTAALAILPIENSLHGSVFEHYDLLLDHEVRVIGEVMLRIRHNVITAPGVRLDNLRRIMSHPVALSQCRKWLRDHPQIEVVPFYDTAGSVKEIMRSGARDCAGLAPALAAEQYGAQVLVSGVEDHQENYTRFYLLTAAQPISEALKINKASLAFSLEHRPGSLIEALENFRRAGLNLTKIESRPVPGRPWEYIFFVDVRFDEVQQLETALHDLRATCDRVKELGRYLAAARSESQYENVLATRE